ncbi:unnamed protein product [Penicillium salamii]|uniref:Glutamine amidotransferase domain-containing protein n=1 Tax=Penicillium salamii TaxID=1612424 RepID=A0A9W4NGX6_9EURO|nr:unnamed protein product [Penicillium salamii]CAG8181520.1 unnamed protein product [Penicillium salamii]CAG8291743.1 unnamed protein product [Penicillium salamii]CAG8357428.1 unnamed protein product [Penicillium salamii]CAG8368369.1 unnamed protein product [Penicillium salamii]
MSDNIHLNVAILSCDTPVESVLKKYGDYFVIYKEFLRQAFGDIKVTFSEHDMVEMEPFPDLKNVDAMIMTGSKHDAWSDAPWILSLTDQIQQALTHKVPVVGICFGHQILARALGAKVGRGDSWEISVGNVDLTESGKALFGKDTLSIQQMHRDIVFTLPEGCVNLGTSPLCQLQGLYSPHKLLSVQGHPEYHEGIMNCILETRHDSGVFNDELYKDAKSRAGNLHDSLLIGRVISKFVLDAKVARLDG